MQAFCIQKTRMIESTVQNKKYMIKPTKKPHDYYCNKIVLILKIRNLVEINILVNKNIENNKNL